MHALFQKSIRRRGRACHRCSVLLTLLLGELLLVEFQFLALKNVAIATASLPWAGRNASQNVTGVVQICEVLINDSSLGISLELGRDVLGDLLLLPSLVGFLNLLLVQLDIVVLKIPLSEWVWIN